MVYASLLVKIAVLGLTCISLVEGALAPGARALGRRLGQSTARVSRPFAVKGAAFRGVSHLVP